MSSEMVKRNFVYVKLCQLMLFLCCTSLVRSKDWNNRKLYLKSIKPHYVHILERNPVRVYCGSSSPVNWTYCPLLAFTFDAVHSRHEIGHKAITLIDLLENDTGYYNCHGKYHNTDFIINMFVLVMKRLFVGLVAPSLTEALSGGSVTLHCGSAGSVEWFSVHYQNQTKTLWDNSLTLNHLRKEHSGYYVCRGRWNRTTQGGKTFHSTAIILVDSVIQHINRVKPDILHSNLMETLRTVLPLIRQ